MKTKLITGIAAALTGGIIFFTACKKEDQTGRMTVKMTDAPAAYLSVNVDVTGLSVNTSENGWIDLPVNAGVYDLLTLQNNVDVVLAGNATLPAGHINQLRLQLGPANSIVTVNGTFPLTIPSGSETGLKVNIDLDLLPDHTMVLLLDFDANASVVENGAGDFSLKPVIQLKSVVQ